MNHSDHIRDAVQHDIDEHRPDVSIAEKTARQKIETQKRRRNMWIPLVAAASVVLVVAGGLFLNAANRPDTVPAAERTVSNEMVIGSWRVQDYTFDGVSHNPAPDVVLTLTLSKPTSDGAAALVTNICTPSTAWWELQGGELTFGDGWVTTAMPCPSDSIDYSAAAPGFLDLTNSWTAGVRVAIAEDQSTMTLTTSDSITHLQRVKTSTN